MEKIGKTAFGERLTKAREHAQMTQIQAAKRVGMSQGTLGEAENSGNRSAYTAQLATLYGVNPNWLATGNGRMLDSDNSGRYMMPVPTPPEKEGADIVGEILNLIGAYRDADKEGRAMIMSSARVAARNSSRKRGAGNQT